MYCVEASYNEIDCLATVYKTFNPFSPPTKGEVRHQSRKRRRYLRYVRAQTMAGVDWGNWMCGFQFFFGKLGTLKKMPVSCYKKSWSTQPTMVGTALYYFLLHAHIKLAALFRQTQWFFRPPHSDATQRNGFMLILLLILQLKPGGLLIGGPPCGSWVFINRGTSKRSKRRVLGDCKRQYVRDSNTTLDQHDILILLNASCKIYETHTWI